MLDIIGTIITGFIVGLIARAIMPGEQKLGFILTVVLGVAGSFLAGFIGQAIGWYKVGAPVGYIASVVGALVLLFGYGLVMKGKGGSDSSDQA
jgi:uncharacterized membrane protein YeaQ/YmgE (transglycosylase-associated protein family)